MNKFFLKRKNESDNSQKAKKKVKMIQDEISSDEDFSELDAKYSEESSDEETVQEKKLRLVKKYISEREKEQERNSLDTREAISHRLIEKVYKNVVPEPVAVFKKHKLSITALAVSPCENYLFSGSKDSCIIKWDLVEKKELKIIKYVKKGTDGPGHTNPVLALALSSDGKFLASGCEGKMIKIWSSESMDLLKTFTGHKGPITGLVFQKGTHNLISSSKDRSLKLWNLDEMGYIETLFGHQDAVAGIDFCGESVVTCGGRDGTVRLWKIIEESQLIYNGDGGSIDCIATCSFQSFVSGGEDGALHLWNYHKKKPRSKTEEAHGKDDSEEPNWIVSLTSLKNSNIIASGSKDGFVRLWRQDEETHSLVAICRIPVTGFINCIEFSPSGKYLIVGVGQEHKLGRWWKMKKAKNAIVMYKL